jgi:hypothetical protein
LLIDLCAFSLAFVAFYVPWNAQLRGPRADRRERICHDNISSSREKQFIGFFDRGAEYYTQTNGWAGNGNVRP